MPPRGLAPALTHDGTRPLLVIDEISYYLATLPASDLLFQVVSRWVRAPEGVFRKRRDRDLGESAAPLKMVFIRAPRIRRLGAGVAALAHHQNECVMASYVAVTGPTGGTPAPPEGGNVGYPPR